MLNSNVYNTVIYVQYMIFIEVKTHFWSLGAMNYFVVYIHC